MIAVVVLVACLLSVVALLLIGKRPSERAVERHVEAALGRRDEAEAQADVDGWIEIRPQHRA